MPFKSKAQQRWMFATHPTMAQEWAEHTPNMRKLPEKVVHRAVKKAAEDVYALLKMASAPPPGMLQRVQEAFHGLSPQAQMIAGGALANGVMGAGSGAVKHLIGDSDNSLLGDMASSGAQGAVTGGLLGAGLHHMGIEPRHVQDMAQPLIDVMKFPKKPAPPTPPAV